MKATIPQLLFCYLFLMASLLIPALGVPSHASSEGPSTETLEDLLDVIENPKRREAFVKDLKALLAAKRALEEKKGEDGQKDEQVFLVRWAFGRLEDLAGHVRQAVVRVEDVLQGAPRTAQKIREFLSHPENRFRLFTLVWNGAIAALIGLLSGFLLSRPARVVLRRMKGLPSRIGWGIVYVALKGLPYLILWMAFIMLSQWWPSFGYGRIVGLLFFGLLFSYRMVTAVCQVALSPGEPQTRILPVADEDAQYLWIWMRRFAQYGVFYFLATRAFLYIPLAPDPYAYLRGLFLIPFPLMVTVFILQVAREIRERRGLPLSVRKGGRVIEAWVRYWPVLAVGYTWAIFLSLMVRYEKGFAYLFSATLGTIAATLILFLCFRGVEAIFRRLFRINEKIRMRFPGLEQRANRYVLMVQRGLVAALTVMGVLVIGDIWGVPVSEFLSSDAGGLIMTRGLAIVMTAAAVVSIIEASNALSMFLLREKGEVRERETTQKRKTLIPVIRTAVNIGAGFVGGVIVLDRLGINTTPILAGAGIVGLAVGFGSQTLVKDLINGLFILFEESIRVGDYARVGNHSGLV